MTQYSKSALARHTRLALLAMTLGLAACGGDGDDTNTNAPGAGGPATDASITTEQAQTSAKSASQPFSNVWDAVSGVVADSKAADVALGATGLDDVSVAIGAGGGAEAGAVVAKHAGEIHSDSDTTAGSDASAAGETPTRSDSQSSGEASASADAPANSGEESQSQLDAAFSAFLSNPTRDGNTLTYRPDVNLACSDETITEVLAEAGDAQTQADAKAICETLVPNITVVQTLTSETEGTLTYRYRDAAPFVVGYAANSVYFQVEFADTKTALQAMAQDLNEPLAEGDLPSTFDGAIRLTATETGSNAGSIRLSVPEAVAVSGATDLGEASFTLAATDKLIEIGGDEAAGTAFVEMDVGTVSATLPDIDAGGAPHLWELAMAAITGRIDVNNNTQQLTVTNLGFGGEPTTVRIDGQEALRVALQNFGATVEGNTSLITLDTALDFSMSVANVFGMMDDFFLDATDPSDPSLTGSLAVSAPAGTKMSVLNPGATTPVTKVTVGGPIDMQGSGEFEGTLSLPVDSCFVQDGSTVMPVAPMQCPQ